MSKLRQTNQQKGEKQFPADKNQDTFYGLSNNRKAKKKARKGKRGY